MSATERWPKTLCVCGHWPWDHGMLGCCTVSGCECADLKTALDFHCRVCGKDTDIAPDPPARAVCEECCEDHDYRYEAELREHACHHCGKYRPQEWGDD